MKNDWAIERIEKRIEDIEDTLMEIIKALQELEKGSPNPLQGLSHTQ